MEKNARKKLTTFYLLSILICFSCSTTKNRSNKDKGTIIKSGETHSYRNIDSINILLSKIENSECGNPIVNAKSLSRLLHHNSTFFCCIRQNKESEVYNQYKRAMNQITLLVDYETNNEYVGLLGYLKDFDDANSFEIAIEILKFKNINIMTVEETQESDTPFVWDVNYSVYTKLLLPNIYSVNNLIFDENHPENKNFMFMILYGETEDFYTYFKELWTTGKIVLKSQVKE